MQLYVESWEGDTALFQPQIFAHLVTTFGWQDGEGWMDMLCYVIVLVYMCFALPKHILRRQRLTATAIKATVIITESSVSVDV